MIKGQFLEGKEGMEPVNREALLGLVRKGAVTVLDVRPAEEYNAGHIFFMNLPNGKSFLAKLSGNSQRMPSRSG